MRQCSGRKRYIVIYDLRNVIKWRPTWQRERGTEKETKRETEGETQTERNSSLDSCRTATKKLLKLCGEKQFAVLHFRHKTVNLFLLWHRQLVTIIIAALGDCVPLSDCQSAPLSVCPTICMADFPQCDFPNLWMFSHSTAALKGLPSCCCCCCCSLYVY